MRADSRHLPWPSRLLLAAFLLAAAIWTPQADGAARDRGRMGPDPAGVCYPVNGEGYIVSPGGLRTPVGSLTPVAEGESLVVLTGTITVVDFRTGLNPTYGSGTRLVVPHVRKRKPPAWWPRMQYYLVRSMTEPDTRRIGGSVRETAVSCWPDSTDFAPGLPISFQWAGVRPAPTALLLIAGRDSVRLPLVEAAAPVGRFAWTPPDAFVGRDVVWTLTNESRGALASGRFSVLPPDEARRRRDHYVAMAAKDYGPDERALAAAVLAAVDGNVLW